MLLFLSASVSSCHFWFFCWWFHAVLNFRYFASARHRHWSLGKQNERCLGLCCDHVRVKHEVMNNFTCCLATCNSCRVVCRSVENLLCFRRFHSDINTSIQNINVESCNSRNFDLKTFQYMDLNARLRIPLWFHFSQFHVLVARSCSFAP
jgi:hypothetical protein